jgi:iron complex outermembrane receptor protein
MQQPSSQQPGQDILDLPIERLAQQPVLVPALDQPLTSVARQESTVGDSPAAVFVITNEMIRRSGATSVAAALRMVPGLDVAQIDNANWAISSRGFNDRFANKMLVQVDGRTVYNPVFSGVYWQTQDLALQDIDRIEVIRGPGATVWGANAVNGIVNIITKSSKDTQGGLLFGGGGTEERSFSGFRYGAQCGDDLYYRVWGKWREVDHGFSADGESVEDWRTGRGGVRVDWQATDCDSFTFQGDMFEVREGLFDRLAIPAAPFNFINVEDRRLTGGDVLGRWRHEIAQDSDWTLQLYYDNIEQEATIASFAVNTFDLDFQQQFPLTNCQQFIYGFGYRFQDIAFGQSEPADGFQVRPIPPGRDLSLFSAFVQDQFTLVDDRLYFTAGTKLENNSFTNFEYQPTGRLLWKPDERQAAWAAISRAVRIPNFQEHNIRITPPGPPGGPAAVRIVPNPGFESEDLLAYELGYRAQPTDAFSWDVAVFFHDYNDLRVTAPGGVAPGFLALQFQNRMVGETYGVELASNYKLSDCWRLYAAYTFLDMELHADDDLADAFKHGPDAEGREGQSPQNQIYLQSSWDLPCHMELDLIGRFVDHLQGFAVGAADVPVDSYIELDIRLGWRPCTNVQVAVVGQNLLDSHHLEFGTNSLVGRPAVQVDRGVYGMIEWRF